MVWQWRHANDTVLVSLLFTVDTTIAAVLSSVLGVASVIVLLLLYR